jgi:hypothetical protein
MKITDGDKKKAVCEDVSPSMKLTNVENAHAN